MLNIQMKDVTVKANSLRVTFNKWLKRMWSSLSGLLAVNAFPCTPAVWLKELGLVHALKGLNYGCFITVVI